MRVWIAVFRIRSEVTEIVREFGLCCDKNNKLSLIKKKHKNKRELKTETRNDPFTMHIHT